MANGFVQGGGRGDFPVRVLTVSRMADRGLRRITPGREALVLGHMTARGPADALPFQATDKPPAVPGSPGYVGHQVQCLTGTDIRNFTKSEAASRNRGRVR